MFLPDAPPEEALAAVAGGGPVVLARGPVTADRAVLGYHARLNNSCKGGSSLDAESDKIWYSDIRVIRRNKVNRQWIHWSSTGELKFHSYWSSI